MPFGDTVEAEAVVGLAGTGEGVKKRRKFGEEALASIEAREEPLANKAGDQELEFEFRAVGGGAGSSIAVHGPEGFESAQSLTGGTFTNLEALGNGIHGKRLWRSEEEAVDLAMGARISKQVGEFRKNLGQSILKVDLCSGIGGKGFLWQGGDGWHCGGEGGRVL